MVSFWMSPQAEHLRSFEPAAEQVAALVVDQEPYLCAHAVGSDVSPEGVEGSVPGSVEGSVGFVAGSVFCVPEVAGAVVPVVSSGSVVSSVLPVVGFSVEPMELPGSVTAGVVGLQPESIPNRTTAAKRTASIFTGLVFISVIPDQQARLSKVWVLEGKPTASFTKSVI